MMKHSSSVQTTGKGCLGRRDTRQQRQAASILELHHDSASVKFKNNNYITIFEQVLLSSVAPLHRNAT